MIYISAEKVKKEGETIALIFGVNYKVYTLNLETMKSGTVDNVSYEREGHSSSTINNHVYLFGGCVDVDNYNDLQMFDIDTDTLVEIEAAGEPPCSRAYHGNVVIRNILYVFGGYYEDYEEEDDEMYGEEFYYNDIHSFNPVSK